MRSDDLTLSAFSAVKLLITGAGDEEYSVEVEGDRPSFVAIRTPSPSGDDYPEVRLWNWSDVEEDFARWAALAAPSERSRFSAFARAEGGSPELESARRRLTEAEKVAFAHAVCRIRAFIIAVGDVREDRLDELNVKLDFLVKAAETDSWSALKYFLLGTVASVLINLTIGQDEGRKIWTFVESVVSAVVTSTGDAQPPAIGAPASPSDAAPAAAIEMH